MPRVLSVRAIWTMVRAGDLRARLRAAREGQAALRLHLAAAALATGLVDALAAGPGSTQELAGRMGATDEALLTAWLRAAAVAGLIGEDGGSWRLTARGRALVDDDLVRATYEGFAGFHTGLYRELGRQLAGGPRRRDVAEEGGLIARLSEGFQPLVREEITRTVTELRPRRVLDVGCGTGAQLAAMLAAVPGAQGVGVDVDGDAVTLAEQTLAARGLAGRGRVLKADVRELRDEPPFDLALLANVVYYVPVDERVEFLRTLTGLLAPGATLLVVTTVAAPQLFSRHFDLLLRAQEGRMELPEVAGLTAQLEAAGLRPGQPRRIAPGDPLVALRATRP